MKSLPLLILIIIVGLIFLRSVCFVVNETEQALILSLGKPVRMIIGNHGEELINLVKEDLNSRLGQVKKPISLTIGAGLYFKKPLIEKVVIFEDRLLEYDSEPTDIVTKDKKHLMVDNFARWRIINPLDFYESVQTEARVHSRLDDIIYSTVREYLAQNDLIEVVRTSDKPLEGIDEHQRVHIQTGRERIMNEITKISREKALPLGIYVLDVRIKRAELPSENEQAVFGRMKAERERISKQYRSEGQEMAQRIKADTDLEVKIILANAEKEAEIIRGDADAKVTSIYADAYSNYEDFYRFQKSLEAIEAVVNDKTTTVMSTESGLFKILSGQAPKIK
ncbi:protease modulator HflC [bacterium]|nr:protease modulator HflC [bacterium]